MKFDITLIGAGIMSATLAQLLKELNPNFRICILETLDHVALESSSSWNNAGTGHSGLCELNYTPEINGEINIEKALHITEAFEKSRQFWSYFVEKENIDPTEFIHSIPHMSIVEENDIEFLKKRYEKMKSHHFYKDMEYCDLTYSTSEKYIYNYRKLIEWMPLVMSNRINNVAATRIESGTDVNFGKLTELLIHSALLRGVRLLYNSHVKTIKKVNNEWRIKYMSRKTNKIIDSKFVFIGAGGGSLLLLEKTHIPESKGYGGFPISGQWLVCKNKEVVKNHNAKVYGKASKGAPPMSVPHLDTRIIDGKKELLFGPFAGFSTKFLRNGSYWDLFKSIKISNLWSMLKAGWHNIPLTKYLIKEVRANNNDKIKELQQYYPDAIADDWMLKIAGQRVQVIKKDKKEGGILEFGTEVVTSTDGTMSALLGASPGASTSVDIMISLIEKCFPEMRTEEWIEKMKVMVPSYQKSLIKDSELYSKIKSDINKSLKTI